MFRLIRNLTKALAAFVVLAGLLGGMPYFLSKSVGWPLWNQIPNFSHVTDFLKSSAISDDIIVKIIATIAWVAWMELVFCVFVELFALIRGTSPVHVPFSSPMQLVARRLIASIALAAATTAGISPLQAFATAPAGPTLDARPNAALYVDAASLVKQTTAPTMTTTHSNNTTATSLPGQTAPTMSITPSTSPTDVAGVQVTKIETPVGAAPTTTAKLLTVSPRDTLWDLAEKHLGDPFRWHEIFDMNVGSTQPGGQALKNPDLIRPGWTLLMPADATGVESVARTVIEQPTTQAPVPTPMPVPTPVPVPDAVVQPSTSIAPPVSGMTPGIPGVQAPGMPKDEAPVSTTIPAPPTTNFSAPTIESGPTAPIETAASSSNNTLFTAGVVGLLAAAALSAAAMFRRRDRQRRRLNTWAAPPVIAVAEEEELHQIVDTSHLAWIELGMRSLAGGLHKKTLVEWPLPHAVLVSEDRIETLLGSGSHFDAPAPWIAEKGGWSWSLIRPEDETEIRKLAAVSPNPLPALTTLGTNADGTFYVDLEAFGSAALVGDRNDVRSTAASIALELAGTSTANATPTGATEVICVGLKLPQMPGFAHVRNVASLADIVPEIEARSKAMGDTLATVQRPNTFSARTGSFGDDFNFAPVVVIVDSASADDAAAERLCELADGGGLGLAVLFAGEHASATWLFEVDGDQLCIASLGVTVRRTNLTSSDVSSLRTMLSNAEAAPVVVAMPHDPVAVVTNEANVIDLREGEGVGHEVEVRVIGTVDVYSPVAEITDAKAVELLALLAFHREGMNASTIAVILYGAQGTVDQVQSLVLTVNTTLGTPSTGGAYIAEATDGLFRLSPLVGTDLDTMAYLNEMAESQESAEAILTLSDALDLVRAVPFTAEVGFGWAHAEHLVDKVDAILVDVAHRLAELCLEASDAPGALWAVNQGLVASPVNEMLYCDRMLAFYLVRDTAGIDETMQELERKAAETTPQHGVSAETRALYKMLLRGDDATVGSSTDSNATPNG